MVCLQNYLPLILGYLKCLTQQESPCVISFFTDESGTSICYISYRATNFRRFPDAFVSSTQYKSIGKPTVDAIEVPCYEST
jgi:hypothetical protein